MNKINHPIIAYLFAVTMVPLLVLGMAVCLIWRSIQAGMKAVDNFIEWM